MTKAGRPHENLYDKWIKGKEEIIVSACRNGATVEDLTRIIGCGKTVFHKIKKEFSEFSELLKESKEEADLKVENALFKRACGFEYEETTNEVRLNQDGSAGQIVSVKKTKKIIPPDTGAAMAWLKNRQPEKWKDRHDLDVTINPFLDLMKAASQEERE
jgi:transposase-like protein